MKTSALFVACTLALIGGFVVAQPMGGPPVRIDRQVATCDLRTPITSLPFVITSSGSYVVRQNLVGLVNENGIMIEADNVTIDLGGWTLFGVPGSLDGIVGSSGLRRNITILNGNVRDWNGDGIDLGNAIVSRIQSVHSESNGGRGLVIAEGGIAERCTADSNAMVGILALQSTVASCTATHNMSAGMRILSGSTARDCVSAFNDEQGFKLDDGSIAVSCVAEENVREGFQSDGASGCALHTCTAWFNGIVGISIGEGVIENCSVNSTNGIGIQGDESLIRGCVSLHNSGVDFDNLGDCDLYENKFPN
ncbi:MAG: right-handed parallel beta-helix repeat-containing protein [Phycisphaerales bacterium]